MVLSPLVKLGLDNGGNTNKLAKLPELANYKYLFCIKVEKRKSNS